VYLAVYELDTGSRVKYWFSFFLFPRITGSLSLTGLLIGFHGTILPWLGFRGPLEDHVDRIGFFCVAWLIGIVACFILDVRIAKRLDWFYPLDLLFGNRYSG